MSPIAKEPDSLTSSLTTAGTTTSATKSQPAAAEIRVTVNGARAVEGSDKREPFSENTQTVLVFANGAVIRLSSAVASGQLLFLTNEKTKKEVVCQVVKSKNYTSVSGYVELEFTEAAPGFWGLRFPTNGPATSAPSIAKSVAPAPANSKSLEQKLTEANVKAPLTPTVVSAPKLIANKPVSVAPAAVGESVSAASRIPTLSEFLMKGESGPALKPPDKSKQESAPQTPALNPQDSKQQHDSLNNLLSPAALSENPAPGTSTYDFGTEEVKIPAWLEPLARNSSTNVVPQQPKAPVVVEFGTKSLEVNPPETKPSEPLHSDTVHREQNKIESPSPESAIDHSAKREAVLMLSGEGPTPNFGSSLALDTKSSAAEASTKGSGQGLLLGIAAAALLFAAGGASYWYSNQPKDVSANVITAPQNNFKTSAPSGTASPVTATENLKTNSVGPALNAGIGHASASSPTLSIDNKQATPANTFSKSPASGSSAGTGDFEQPELVAQPVKKPSLGRVRLAKPTVGRHVSSSDANSPDLAPSLSGEDVAGGDASSLNPLASRTNQPAAPLPVGGNVKPAQLLSSVAPVYPQMARNQRLSGDVKIDAVIGENGHVSSMKVISGPALLHQAAMDALRQWKYQPATLNGQPMSMHLTVTVQFRLQQ